MSLNDYTSVPSFTTKNSSHYYVLAKDARSALVGPFRTPELMLGRVAFWKANGAANVKLLGFYTADHPEFQKAVKEADVRATPWEDMQNWKEFLGATEKAVVSKQVCLPFVHHVQTDPLVAIKTSTDGSLVAIGPFPTVESVIKRIGEWQLGGILESIVGVWGKSEPELIALGPRVILTITPEQDVELARSFSDPLKFEATLDRVGKTRKEPINPGLN